MADYLKLSDAELIARCQDQDALAWETLVRRYQRLIASITRKFLLTADDAADVFQGVCLALFQQLPNLKKQTKISSWIITVSVRECWKLREKLGRTDLLDEEEWQRIPEPSDAHGGLAEEVLLTLERQHLLRRAVELLPAQCRQLLESLFYQDEPVAYSEISRQLGMPVASIGPTRARCLNKLKENLKQVNFF